MPCPGTQRHLARLGVDTATFWLLARFPHRSATWLPIPKHYIFVVVKHFKMSNICHVCVDVLYVCPTACVAKLFFLTPATPINDASLSWEHSLILSHSITWSCPCLVQPRFFTSPMCWKTPLSTKASLLTSCLTNRMPPPLTSSSKWAILRSQLSFTIQTILKTSTVGMGFVNFYWYQYHFRDCLTIWVFIDSTINTFLFLK